MTEHPPFETGDGSLPGSPPVQLPDPEPIGAPAVGPTGAVATPGSARSGLTSWIGAGVAAAALVVGGAVVIGRSGPVAADADPAAATTAATSASESGSSTGSATSGPGDASGSGSPSRPSDAAGPEAMRPPGGAGAITAIDGTTLTLAATDPSGAETTLTVTTDDTTTYTEVVAGAVPDLAVGDHVVVMGEADDTGTAVTAAAIVDRGDQAPLGGRGGGMPGGAPPEGMAPPEGVVPPEGMAPPEGMTPPDGAVGHARPTMGTITAIDGATVTVEDEDGSAVTVTTTADTQVSVIRAITFADLRVGDSVRVHGESDGTTVTAVAVQRGDLTAGPMMGGHGGGRPGGPSRGSDSSPTATPDGE